MNLSLIKNKIWLWFFGINIFLPAFSVLFKINTVGFIRFDDFKASFIVAPILFFVQLILFWKLTSPLFDKLEKFKNRKVDGDDKDKQIKYINDYPFRAAFLIGIYSFVIPTISEIYNLYRGDLFSWQQFLFLWISDLAISAISTFLFFYRIKIILYPSVNFLPFTPISLYHRILVPILITIQIMVLISSAAVYHIGVSEHKEFMKKIMSLNIEEASLYLNTTLEKLIIQTDSYTKNDVVRGMNPFLVMDYLKDLHNDKEEFVKSYFVSDMNGDTVNSQGFRFNVKKGKIFQSILKTEKFAISNPVKSLDDGTWILVSAVPVKYRKKLIGNFGMTFAIETLGEALKNASDNGKYDFIMISDDGRVVYNQNYKYLNLEFKKELANSKEYFGLEDLPTRDLTGFNKFNREFIDIVFEGKKMYGMLIDMPKFNSKLFMFIPKKVFYKDLNSTLLKISGFIIFITGAVIFVIRYISNNLAGPIKNTIVAFEKISNGDLTVESNDYVPDEFGEIIRYLGNLIIVLRNTVALIQSSSKELENTSEDLTNTTQTMARNSQEQAHSLQSSEDLVINLSNSVEEVADLSKNAHQSSKNTFSSMEELKDRVREVKEITIEAKDLTKSTSDEANRGNELMKDAIFGMQRISTSTKKISETIGLIGDISKQVNLLALNAAIEAARAGEFGQGFTVVAEEIGKLAEKTSRSAKNIKEYIQEGILEVDRGKNYVDNTAKALSNIITSIQKNTFLINKITDSAIVQAEFSEKVLIAVKNVMEMAERISSTTEDQTSSNQELTQSMSMISDLTSSLAKGAEDIALTSIKISEQSRTLNRMIEFFKI